MYLIEILHQTTTCLDSKAPLTALYLIEILHQTTTCIQCASILSSCILSKFYIKPQPETMQANSIGSCILSKFYIKPQLIPFLLHSRRVVSYRNSTSNHNNEFAIKSVTPLYLIEILHQTTTSLRPHRRSQRLYLIEILHQTTTF